MFLSSSEVLPVRPLMINMSSVWAQTPILGWNSVEFRYKILAWRRRVWRLNQPAGRMHGCWGEKGVTVLTPMGNDYGCASCPIVTQLAPHDAHMYTPATPISYD